MGYSRKNPQTLRRMARVFDPPPLPPGFPVPLDPSPPPGFPRPETPLPPGFPLFIMGR